LQWNRTCREHMHTRYKIIFLFKLYLSIYGQCYPININTPLLLVRIRFRNSYSQNSCLISIHTLHGYAISCFYLAETVSLSFY